METYTIILVFPVLIVAVLFFAEALFVLIKEWISQSTIALTLLCIANGGWLFSFGLMYWSTNPMDAFFWASIGICFTVLISPSAFHFATAVCHTYERRRYWVYGAWLIGFGFVYAQLAHHVMFDEMYQYWFGYYPNYNWPAIIELTYFFGFLLWAIAEFFQIMLTKKPNSRMYYRSYLFGISYSIGSFGAIDILPMWGVPVFPFGFTLLIVSVAMTIYIVTRYRLIDITPYLAANEIVETMVDCLLVCDISDRICVANSAANNTLYSNNQSLRGHKLNEFFSILSFREFLELKNQGDFQNREFWMYERQKGYQQYSISMTHIYDPALEYLIGYIIVARNIQTYKDMQRYQENLASMLLHNPSPVMEFDQTGSLTFANYAAQHLMANWYEQLPSDLEQLAQRVADGGQGISEEYEDEHCVYLFMAQKTTDQRRVTVYGMDITDRKTWEREVERAARIDPVTYLPNRYSFEEILSRELRNQKQSPNPKMVLLMIDLDDFKLVNDTMGHPFGDQLLRQVAQRITEAVRPQDIVARIGGDEFMVLLANLQNNDGAEEIATRIIDNFNRPFYIQNHELRQSVSIGVAGYQDVGDHFADLMKNVDRAMLQAKKFGKNQYAYYSKTLEQRHFHRAKIKKALKESVEQELFYLVCQPQYHIANHNIVGLEVLLRFKHPEILKANPAELIAHAEETGDILAIDDWVMHTLKTWALKKHQQRLTLPKLAFNVSAKGINSRAFLEHVHDIATDDALPKGTFEMELTETALMSQNNLDLKLLKQCHENGLRFAIDDFGTGYSSLEQLLHIPVDTLKIDERFVRDVNVQHTHQAIVRAVIQLSINMGSMVVAEGVETQQEAQFLVDNNCAFAQGFYYARPLTLEQVDDILPNHNES